MRYSTGYIIAGVIDEIKLSDIEEAHNGMLRSSIGPKDYKMPKQIIHEPAKESQRECNIKLF